MKTWLHKLLESIDAFSDEKIESHKSKTPVGDGEKVIGTVPKELRRFLAYHHYLVDKLKALMEAHRKEHHNPNHTPEMCDKFLASAKLLSDEIELVGKVFWQELRDVLKIEANSIAVREEWQVVKMPEEPSIKVIHVSMGDDPLEGLSEILADLIMNIHK